MTSAGLDSPFVLETTGLTPKACAARQDETMMVEKSFIVGSFTVMNNDMIVIDGCRWHARCHEDLLSGKVQRPTQHACVS